MTALSTAEHVTPGRSASKAIGMAPSLTLESYRQIGRNAAGYALACRSRRCRR